VGHHGHVLAGMDRARELTQGVQSAARRRPAHDVEPEAPREVRHQLAVARAAGQHAHAPGALAPTKPRVEPRHDEDAAVPDGVDQRATLSVRAAGVDALRPLWQARRPRIYAVWHGRILIVPWLNARLRRSEGARRVRVLASRSRDGQLMADFARRFGLDVVRGSSSRGGLEALRELTRAIRAGEDVAMVPDGPRGPARRLQGGIVALAATTGAPIVPVGVAARPARRLG